MNQGDRLNKKRGRETDFIAVAAVILLIAGFFLLPDTGTFSSSSSSSTALTGFALYETQASAGLASGGSSFHVTSASSVVDAANPAQGEVFPLEVHGYPKQSADPSVKILAFDFTVAFPIDKFDFAGVGAGPNDWAVDNIQVTPEGGTLRIHGERLNFDTAISTGRAARFLTLNFRPKVLPNVNLIGQSGTFSLTAASAVITVASENVELFDPPNAQANIAIRSKFYTDADRDRFGSNVAGAYVLSDNQLANPPQGSAASNTDCKDDDVAVNPEIAEVCDGKDNDCNPATKDFDPNNPVQGQHTCQSRNYQCGVHYTCGNMYLLDCNNPQGVVPGRVFAPVTGNAKCTALNVATPVCNYETGQCIAVAANCPVGGAGGACPAGQQCSPNNFIDPTTCPGGAGGGGAGAAGGSCVIPEIATPGCGLDINNDGNRCDHGNPLFENCATCPADCDPCPVGAPDADADGVPDAQEKPNCENNVDCDGDGIRDNQDVCPSTLPGAIDNRFTIANGYIGLNGCFIADVGVKNGPTRPDGCITIKDAGYFQPLYEYVRINGEESCRLREP